MALTWLVFVCKTISRFVQPRLNGRRSQYKWPSKLISCAVQPRLNDSRISLHHARAVFEKLVGAFLGCGLVMFVAIFTFGIHGKVLGVLFGVVGAAVASW